MNNEEILQNSLDFIDKSVETSYKTLNTNLINTVNSVFINYETDFDKKQSVFKEEYSLELEKYTEELELAKLNYLKLKQRNSLYATNLIKIFHKLKYLKKASQLFRTLANNKNKNKQLNKNYHIVKVFLKNKKRKLIFNSWRNIVNFSIKSRIKAKGATIFNEKYTLVQTTYTEELKRLQEILNSLEIVIKKEIDERRDLSRVYDEAMSKGVEQFIKETNPIYNFNSSAVQTPREKSYK